MTFPTFERWTVRVVADHAELHAYHDLPAEVAADFDYIDEDEAWTPRFASYQSKAGDTIWLDIHDMFEDGLPEWFHRTQSDSFFTAHGINWHDDDECPHDDCAGIALIMT